MNVLRRLIASLGMGVLAQAAPGCQDELRRLAPQMDEGLARFYDSLSYDCAWIRAGKPTLQAQVIAQAFAAAASKGLDPREYDVAAPAGVSPASDLAFTQTAIRFVSDLCAGRVNRGTDRCDAPGRARLLVNALDPSAMLRDAEPSAEGYRRALTALAEYRLLAAEDPSPEPLTLPDNGAAAIKAGDAFPDAELLARRLRRLGDLAVTVDEPAAGEPIFAGALVDSVKRFQRRHGLKPDGEIGSRTLEQLNTPPAARVKQLRIALERWRAENRVAAALVAGQSQRGIEVNIPEFRLRAFEADGSVGLEMRVVVGSARRHRTPTFSAAMTSVVFHPYWNVPWSIQRNELIPEIERNSQYPAEHGFEVVTASSEVVPDGTDPAEVLAGLRAGTFFLRQVPGPGNALGEVTFKMPNEYSVYLHDTPQRSLFGRARRDFSHGCIRLESPRALLSWVLKDDPQWPAGRIEEVLNSGETTYAAVVEAIPVSIVYRSTFVPAAGGAPHFLPDIYGLDAAVDRQLIELSQAASTLLAEVR